MSSPHCDAGTNGSSIVSKGSALVWKFDEVDPEFGLMQAKQLGTDLEELVRTHALSS